MLLSVPVIDVAPFPDGSGKASVAAKVGRHISRLRVRNYPAPSATPQPGPPRAGAQADYGSLTILRTEDRPGGPQVLNRGAAVPATTSGEHPHARFLPTQVAAA